MYLHELKIYAVKMVKENPTLRKEIYDFVQLAIDEIEEGGSEQHECSLAQRDIEFIVNEMLIEKEMEKINSSGEDKTVHGYSNEETYIMISHIHNDQLWLENAWENISEYNNSRDLKFMFKHEIFNNGGLSDVFGKMSFERINWFEIFNNLKEIMPKIPFEVGDWLMIVNGEGLGFDWEGKVFVFDSVDNALDGSITIGDYSGDTTKFYVIYPSRATKVTQTYIRVPESDRWISEWRNQDNQIVGINFFQGIDSWDEFQEDFDLPDVELTKKVLSRSNQSVDDAIWSIIREENISKEELIERLALAKRQAIYLSKLLYDLKNNCHGYGSLEDEISTIHNINLLTDISTDEWNTL